MSETAAILIPLSNRLKERLCSDGDGLSFEEMLARSAAIVEKLSADWRAGAVRDAERLLALARRMRSNDEGAAGLLASSFTIAHDLHGQAGTFGYSEVGEVALALCAQLAAADAGGADFLSHLPRIEQQLIALHGLLSADVRDGAPLILDLRRAG